MRSLEAVAVAASQLEPVLLVGETGTGKTTLVQHLAEQVISQFSKRPQDSLLTSLQSLGVPHALSVRDLAYRRGFTMEQRLHIA